MYHSVPAKGEVALAGIFSLQEVVKLQKIYCSWKCHLLPPGDENALRFHIGMRGTPSCGPCINPGTSLPLPQAG